MAISNEDNIMPMIKSEPLEEEEVKEVMDKYYTHIIDTDDKAITIKIEPWYSQEEKDYEIGLISPDNNEILNVKTEPGLLKKEDNRLICIDTALSANAELKNDNIDVQNDTVIKKDKALKKVIHKIKNDKYIEKKIQLKKRRELKKDKIGIYIFYFLFQS